MRFIKGIVGWGYYVFPPALLVSAVTLLFYRKRPVSFRVISALMTPLFLGAIFHLFSAGADTVFDKTVISVLYGASGSAMASGGVLSRSFCNRAEIRRQHLWGSARFCSVLRLFCHERRG